MNEFIKKLIERLEEVGKLEISMHGGRCNGKTLALGYAKGIENSISIVNQLAEEYKINHAEILKQLIQAEKEACNKFCEARANGYDDAYVDGFGDGVGFAIIRQRKAAEKMHDNLLYNQSGYRDPTAYEAIRNVSKKNGGFKMTSANKVKINEIGEFENTIAKCGLLSLICIGKPQFNLFTYKITSGDEIIFESFRLSEAVKKYNDLIL